MATINEIKEKMVVVNSVGGFANALQQIATMRMMTLRDRVVASKRFVDAATELLRELYLYKEIIYQQTINSENNKSNKNKKGGTPTAAEEKIKKAIILISSNQGLCGKFNAEIFRHFENEVLPKNPEADIFIIGKKGQEHYIKNAKFKYKFYPYLLGDDFTSQDLLRLVDMFPYYDRILMVYSRYINTANREIMQTMLVVSPTMNQSEADPKEKIKFIFEPSLDQLIKDISSQLRAATFQQQILDSRLAQFSAQMMGMQAATENAKVLLDDLKLEYNKQRRKLIDKKISEVFAGSALW